MKVDTNTNGHRQWFFFSVRNNKKCMVRFNIFRFKKKYSLFQRGLKPYIYSLKQGKGWVPGGMNIRYREEKHMNDYGNESKKYYLTFDYKFQKSEDEVFFSCGIPYTYSYLQKRLLELEEKSAQSLNFSRGKLVFKNEEVGKSLCGLEMQAITIQPNNSLPKKYIVINARTHAGQFSSSWVMDGILKRLVEEPQIHEWMVQNSVSFKILPMLNPDGVFVGNYRTGIVGDDFNRRFASGKREIFPQIHYLKKIINECKKMGKIYLFLDLHGHSILKNSFIYGPIQSLYANNPLRNLSFNLWHSSKYFQFSSCKFRFQKDLTETARVYFQLKQNILTYTSETSLGLYRKNGKTQQMTQLDYAGLGAAFISSIAQLMVKGKLQKELTMPSISHPQLNNRQNVQLQLQRSRDISKRTKTKQKKSTSFFNQTIQQRKQSLLDNSPVRRQICLEKIHKKNQKEAVNQNQKQPKQKQKKIITVKQKSTKKHSAILIKNRHLNSITQKVSTSIDARKKSEDDVNNNNTPEAQSKLSSFEMTGQKFFNKFRKNEQGSTTSPQRQRQDLRSSGDSQHRHESKFKIRKKAQITRMNVPESFRRKIGNRVFLHLGKKHEQVGQESEVEFKYERSVTYDSSYLSAHLPLTQEQNLVKEEECFDGELEIIDENFSEEYQSINDSDSSSEDLQPKKKEYLFECIRNNRRLKTNINDIISDNEQQELTDPPNQDQASKINRFKQIQFKSLEPKNKNVQGLRPTIRDLHKFRQMTHKSLNRSLYDDGGQAMTNIVQKKQLNARVQRKTQREPYFLVQIKSKNN